jgi:hypothetical protein
MKKRGDMKKRSIKGMKNYACKKRLRRQSVIDKRLKLNRKDRKLMLNRKLPRNAKRKKRQLTD